MDTTEQIGLKHRFLKNLSKGLGLIAEKIEFMAVDSQPIPKLPKAYTDIFAGQALYKVINDFEVQTVLDVGSGEGLHSDVFLKAGKVVTSIDYGDSVYFKKKRGDQECIVADFNEHKFETQFDCLWCSHVLEHQVDVQRFLTNAHNNLKEGGVLAVTVPPLKHVIVGGHVSLWNAGLLLYRLVLAGFNCKDASVLCYGYNISVVVVKDSVDVSNKIEYDSGDIRKIKNYLPNGIKFHSNAVDDLFYGRIHKLNW
ncbi:class I SAM-dependent methyltransferase [uncultured Imperialibacter sp.]|uniref:class I SAM-dependent methyltransferase n=1 Tax=uncultured Imperialibacter sp. TaxID=1672639 RepID=UPI0030D9DE23|tara:strand:+ start:13844 stop:14605 length:762 start_codon:yes stop_codon:yes gene_type:complete